MIRVRIDAKDASARLRRMASRLEDTETPNRALAAQLYKEVQRNFDMEGNDGVPWAPLKEGTIKFKKKKGYALKLQNTDALRASFLPLADNRYAGVGAVSANKHADLAKVHEYGNDYIPARPMLPSDDVATSAALRVYQFYVDRAARE